ncbi:RNA polymerase sigma factor [Lewinella sp. IMCC34183]|uniref:RNA polymerase sigma factor n=1 Tax=Lewinella sp. IMCC34183 TaxID=2248762 RepID=UPI000E2233BC|nr:sigma-70 family RNA polymerase sigma factor [Lewinella sp. IMCC34183]
MNDENAFLELLDHHGGILLKVARLYADTTADRDDLVQEMTYQLWKSFPTFRGDSRISSWMYRVALNTALGRFRRREPRIAFLDSVPEPAAPSGPPENEARRRLFAAIRQLDRADRALVALYLEDLSHEEIGGILGLTANHVGVKLHRTKTKLKTLLNP